MIQINAIEIETEGFAIIPCVLSLDEIFAFTEGWNSLSLSRSRAGIRHTMRHPSVLQLANSTRLLDLAEYILGGTALPFRATLFDKSPESNWLVVWHQDKTLPLRKRHEMQGWGPWSVKDGVNYAQAPASALEQIVALRVHLDDSLAENGPLRVLPGLHKNGILSDDAIRQIASESSPVDCIVPKGGILAMRPLIVHSSSKSQLENPRRVLHIEYARSMAIGAGLDLAVA